jgi:pimeloyl-ACP methyl ester carboxylesterase
MPQTLTHKGCSLAYTLRGDGPPVLLVQGVGCQGDAWSPQVDDLATDFRCLTFDNRGMGKSQPVGAALSIEQMAEDARVLLDAQGWGSVHVVGHSMGGLIALYLALAARERVASLALLCTLARGRDVAPLSWRMFWLGLGTVLGTRRMRRRAFLNLILPPGALAKEDPDTLAARLADLFGHDLADSPPIVSKQLAALRAGDALPRLGELAGVPTLVVSAEHDPIAPPRLGRRLADGIPGARFVEMAGTSHAAPITCPTEVNALLRAHLTGAKACIRPAGLG